MGSPENEIRFMVIKDTLKSGFDCARRGKDYISWTEWSMVKTMLEHKCTDLTGASDECI